MVNIQMTGEEEMNPIGGEKIEEVYTKVSRKNLVVVGDGHVQILIIMTDGPLDDQHLGMMKMKDGIVVKLDGQIILVPMNGESWTGEIRCLNGNLIIIFNLGMYLVYIFRAVDNPGDKGGSFDSSGAFHDNHYDDENHYNMRDEQLPVV